MTQAQSDYLISRIVEKNAQSLMEEFSISLDEALYFIYESSIFSSLNDEKTGLKAQSADYIFELLKEEYLASQRKNIACEKAAKYSAQ